MNKTGHSLVDYHLMIINGFDLFWFWALDILGDQWLLWYMSDFSTAWVIE